MKELIQLCQDKELAICVPHEGGIPVRTDGIFERRQKKGVCLVLDSSLISAAELYRENQTIRLSPSRLESHEGSTEMSNKSKKAFAQTEKPGFKPDVFLSLGSDVAPKGSMGLLHPVTTASLLLYHTKQWHFPSLGGSPHLFSVKQKR